MGTILLCVCCHQFPTPALRSLCCPPWVACTHTSQQRWRRGGPRTNNIWIPALRGPEGCHSPPLPPAEEHGLTRTRSRQPHSSSQTRQPASCGAREGRSHGCFLTAHTSPPSIPPSPEPRPTPAPGRRLSRPRTQSSKWGRYTDSHEGEDGDDGHCDEQLDGDDAVNLQHR